MPGPTRRPRLVVALAAALLLVLSVLGWLALTGLQAKRSLDVARNNLEAARSALLAQDVDGARSAILAAGRETRSARRSTHDPVWSAVGALPLVGASAATASGLAATADGIARRVLPAALDAARVVDPRTVRRADGSIDVTALVAARRPVDTARQRAASVAGQLRELPSSGLVPPVRRARDELAAEVQRLTGALDGAHTALDLAPALLGEDRVRRYFVLIQQTSESRGTGGLPGGFAVLQTDHGKVSVTAQGSNADLQGGAVPVPAGVPQDYVDRYAPAGAFDLWVNVNVSPDLPVVSRVIAARWKGQSGQTLDGVIALDSTALQSLLQGTAPIALPNGRQLPPDQIVRYLAVQQYLDYSPPTGGTGIDRGPERKETLRRISRAATAQLTGGGGDSAALLRGLVDAVGSGHVHMASDDPALQRPLALAGRDGGLPTGPAPVAYPVVFNSTGGKLDYFLDRTLRYTAGPCGGTRRRSRIVVTLRNSVPAGGLPPYLTTRLVDGVATQSLSGSDTLQVYGTRGAVLERALLDGKDLSGETVNGVPVLQQGTESGLPLWSLLVELPKDQTRRLQLDLVEPVVPGRARTPEQPLARPLSLTTDVPSC